MWTNIFHPLGLHKGQVEQVIEASGGQALPSLHCSRVGTTMFECRGRAWEGRLQRPCRNNLRVNRAYGNRVWKSGLINSSLSRYGFLFWKIMVFRCIWISSLQTSPVILFQVCSWWSGALTPQNTLLAQPQGVLSCGGPVTGGWASASVPGHCVWICGLL